MGRELRVEDVAVVRRLVFIGLLFVSFDSVSAQTLPADEVQVHMDGYFDNFGVNIIYPSISLTRRVSSTTSVSGRYLVDVVSAASIKSSSADKQKNAVDAVTSASQRGEGLLSQVDDVRQQFGLGATHLLGKTSLSLNGLFSTEGDYDSKTIAGQISVPFAKNNTVLQAGVVRSWDHVFPVTESWRRAVNTSTYSGGLTQILGQGAVLQLNASYTLSRGYLADAYNVVSVHLPTGVENLTPVHPNSRARKAGGVRTRFMVGERSSAEFGYRYYEDDWDVRSHTISGSLEHRTESGIRLKTGVRAYSQSKASFFQQDYTSILPLMTVDSKLDRAFSTELEFQVILGGSSGNRSDWVRGLLGDRGELTTRFDVYYRHTATPNWFSKSQNLVASIVSIGYRYKF